MTPEDRHVLRSLVGTVISIGRYPHAQSTRYLIARYDPPRKHFVTRSLHTNKESFVDGADLLLALREGIAHKVES